jgi:hypothetical protein
MSFADPGRRGGHHGVDRRSFLKRMGWGSAQPHLRNMAAGSLRRTDGYGSPTLARTWLDK